MNTTSIIGTRTEQNLLKAFAGESQARSRYTFYAHKAKKEGFEEIAKYFAETAANEEEHAKIFFGFLEGGMVEITASYPAGIIGTTAHNLKEAAEGEYDEWANLYPVYGQIAKYFAETAANEEEHAKIFFGFLEGGMVEITASYPAGIIGTTAHNLKEAAEGEYDEWANLYPVYGQIAEDEGFRRVAHMFRMIVEIEKFHENRYNSLLSTLEAGKMFRKDDPVIWECMKCGFRANAKEAPGVCPVCGKPQGYFELYSDKY